MPGYSETAVPTSAPADSACVWPVFVGQHSSPLSTSVKLVPAKNISLKSVLSYWPLALSFVSLLNQLSFTCFATHVAQALLPVLCLDLYSDHHPNPRQSALIRGKSAFPITAITRDDGDLGDSHPLAYPTLPSSYNAENSREYVESAMSG